MKADPYSGLDLMDPRVLKAMDSGIRDLEKSAHESPGESSLQYQVSRKYALLAEDFVMSVRFYLRYFNLVRIQDDRAHYELLPLPMTLDEIHQTIIDNLNTDDLHLHELEFLFAEMIRQLRFMGDDWPQEGNLSKEKIYSYIFETLLDDWQNLVSLGEPSEREKNGRRLATIILCHLVSTKGISDFESLWDDDLLMPTPEDISTNPTLPFVISTPANPYQLPNGMTVYLSSAELENADLRFTKYGNMDYGDLTYAAIIDFSYANLRGADFYGAEIISIKFEHADLRGADFRGCPDSSDCFITEVYFRGANLRGANFRGRKLNFLIFYKAISLQGADFRDVEYIMSADAVRGDYRGADFRGIFGGGRESSGFSDDFVAFENADLRGTDFRGAYALDLKFVDSDLRGSDFRNVREVESFKGSNLYGMRIHRSLINRILEVDQKVLRGEEKDHCFTGLTQQQISTMIVYEDPTPPSAVVEAAL